MVSSSDFSSQKAKKDPNPRYLLPSFITLGSGWTAAYQPGQSDVQFIPKGLHKGA